MSRITFDTNLHIYGEKEREPTDEERAAGAARVVEYTHMASATQHGNAVFIVRACNEHDELVAALRSSVESFEQFVKLGRIPANTKGLRDALAALARAEAA